MIISVIIVVTTVSVIIISVIIVTTVSVIIVIIVIDIKAQVLGVARPGGRRGMARTSWVQVTLENICVIFANYLSNICKMCKIKYEFADKGITKKFWKIPLNGINKIMIIWHV